MKKTITAALTALFLTGWCLNQLGKQENWYIRCGKGDPARRDPSDREKTTGAFGES